MKALKIIKYIVVLIIAIVGVGTLFWLLIVGKISVVGFFLSLIGLGIFLIFLFNVDNADKLTIKFGLVNVLLKIKKRLTQARKEVAETKQDLEVYAKEEVPIKDGEVSIELNHKLKPPKRLKVHTVVRPKILKLEATINKLEVLVDMAEKKLSGEISAKSFVSAKGLTVKKKKKGK